MYRNVFVVFFTGLSLFSAMQASAQSKADKKMATQLRTDISFLASDSLQGRRTGSEGERIASEYITERYKKLGIPAYKENYRIPFHFAWGKEVAANTHVMLGNIVLRMNEEFITFPASPSKKVSSDVLPGILETGKIWMIPFYNDSNDANNPHFDWEKALADHVKEAEKQGAIGVLFYDNVDAKYPPAFNAHSDMEPLELPVAFMTYKGYTKYILDNKYEAYIGATSGLPVEMNINIKKTDRVGNNVAAYIDNKAPYTVILGAHYDHLGFGEDGSSLYAGKDKEIHNGADDNASGTAALMEMAALLKNSKLKNYNYLFLHFSGEELGLFGSKAFVKDLGIDSARTSYMLNMDMVGRLNDSTHALTIGGIGTSPAWAPYLPKADKEFKVIIDSAGVGPSDHTSFYNVGIPVLFFFTGTHSDYHKPSDDADKINYPGEVEVIRYMYSIVEDMDAQPKPAYILTKQKSVSGTKFKVTLGIMPDYAYQDNGVRVDGVSADRPAMKAGIKTGDIIIKLGEHKILGMQSYMEALGKFHSGDKTEVTVSREGKELTMPLEFGLK